MKRLYPTLGSTIWNKYPNGTEPARLNLREYDEDIRARPEYANHLNAETLISLHTNAAAPAARGARIYTKINDPSSVALSTNVQCYLKEQIQQLPQYVDYPVAANIESATAYAEVREAAMPTVLVELGFHTNTIDAAALQTSAFRSASMRGVEKGYRMFKAGETACKPFKIESIPDAVGPQRVAIPVNVNFAGYPQFPVKLKLEVLACTPGFSCAAGTLTYPNSIPSPIPYTWKCNTSSTSPRTVRYRATLTDADGVKTNSVEHNVTCTPSAA